MQVVVYARLLLELLYDALALRLVEDMGGTHRRVHVRVREDGGEQEYKNKNDANPNLHATEWHVVTIILRRARQAAKRT